MRIPCCDKHKETKKRTWKEVQENQKMNNYVQRSRLSWRRSFGEDEEQLIIKLHALLGNRWSLIAGRLPGRTENEIQNYWNYYLKRKLMNMGINPDKHHVNQSMNLRPSSSSNDRKSDGTSCVDDRNACVLLDLNLELSIYTTHPSHVEPMQHVDESKVAMRHEDESSPVTLSLFR